MYVDSEICVCNFFCGSVIFLPCYSQRVRILGRTVIISWVVLAGCLSSSVGQTKSVDSLTAEIQRGQDLHGRALHIVETEQARAKQPLCPKAATTYDANNCYATELGITDGNYLKLVRALGALLRSGGEADAKTAPARIPFDDAETTWHTYRDQACNAVGDQYDGGTIRPSMEMGCRITLTRHHMDELWDIYSDLGTR